MNSCKRNHHYKGDYKAKDFYINFTSRHPEVKISQLMHTKIIKAFFNVVIRKMVLEMYKFVLPSLGSFYIIKDKQVAQKDKDGNLKFNASINWPETNKVRKLTGDKTKKVVYLNEHTNGYVYKIIWNKDNYNFVNRSFYSFIPCTPFKKYLFKEILENTKPLNAYIR